MPTHGIVHIGGIKMSKNRTLLHASCAAVAMALVFTATPAMAQSTLPPAADPSVDPVTSQASAADTPAPGEEIVVTGSVVTYLDTGLVPRLPTAILVTGIVIVAVLCFFAGLILDTVTRGRREMRRLAYLSQTAPGRL